MYRRKRSRRGTFLLAMLVVVLSIASVEVMLFGSEWMESIATEVVKDEIHVEKSSPEPEESVEVSMLPWFQSIQSSEEESLTLRSFEDVANEYGVSVEKVRALAYLAVGEALSEGEDGCIAVMHVAINRASEFDGGDLLRQIYNHSNFEAISEDGQYVNSYYGRVTDQIVYIHASWLVEKAARVIVGNIPDKTEGALYYLAYKHWGYKTASDFADVHGIDRFKRIQNQIFFYEWNDMLDCIQRYAEDESAEDGYAEDGYAEDGYAEDGYAEDGYAEDGYAEDGYAEDGYAEESYSG